MFKPIFRAEVDFDNLDIIDCLIVEDNVYLEGIPIRDYTYIEVANRDIFPVKKDTWAICVDEILIDNKKIFASLDKVNKKGGDILYWHNMTDEPDCSPSTVVFTNNRIECFDEHINDLDINAMKIIGIQK